MRTPFPFAEAAYPRVVLVHPPAVSKRYLPTKFLPYGMGVLHAFLKEHGVPVSQHDFLMEYLFEAPEDIDVHNPERSSSAEDFSTALEGSGTHRGLQSFMSKYGHRLDSRAEIFCQLLVGRLLGRRQRRSTAADALSTAPGNDQHPQRGNPPLTR